MRYKLSTCINGYTENRSYLEEHQRERMEILVMIVKRENKYNVQSTVAITPSPILQSIMCVSNQGLPACQVRNIHRDKNLTWITKLLG